MKSNRLTFVRNMGFARATIGFSTIASSRVLVANVPSNKVKVLRPAWALVMLTGSAALAEPAQPPADGAGFLWKSQVPEACPFERSATLTGVFFTGRHSDYRCGDTFYPSWASDGNHLNFPSKFISPDGRTLWLCYSANFSPGWNGVDLKFNPPGGRYGLCLHEIKLLGPDPKP